MPKAVVFGCGGWPVGTTRWRVSYLVLARKWRPETFSDLVGQGHVSKTISSAIEQDRVAHAFLFTGVRGVGKTTSARILAKALNCETGPTTTPCLKCNACVEIAQGSNVDVQEIDGASYNGVDEVRRLQESLPYRPQRDRFKIFIVDEVHMLSSSAWNAFLKTLEEPPDHVKFIFATTEVHKVPITILSRCQRYDFKMIPAKIIADRVTYVLGQEQIEADEAAINLVAREAAGSMRDAMSLLDQAIAWGGRTLVGEEVAKVLGVASRSVLHELAGRLVAGDAEGALKVLSKLVKQGYDLNHLARDLLAHLRDLVIANVCESPEGLLDMSADEQQEILSLAKQCQENDLVRLHQGFSSAVDEILRAPHPRASFEMALIRLARRPPLLPVDQILARLRHMEANLAKSDGVHLVPLTESHLPQLRASAPTPVPASEPPTKPQPAQGQAPVSGASAKAPDSHAKELESSAEAAPQVAEVEPVAPTDPEPADVERLSSENSKPAQEPGPVQAAEAPPAEQLPDPPAAAARPKPPSAPSAQATPAQAPAAAPEDAAAAPLPQATQPASAPPVEQAPEPQLAEASPVHQQPPAAPRRVSADPKPSRKSNGPLEEVPTEGEGLANIPAEVHLPLWQRFVEALRDTSEASAAFLDMAAPRVVNESSLVFAYPPGSFAAAQVRQPAMQEALAVAIGRVFGGEPGLEILSDAAATNWWTLARARQFAKDAARAKARQEAVDDPAVQRAVSILGGRIKDVRLPRDERGLGRPGR